MNIIIDRSYFIKKSNKKNNHEYASTLEDILDSIYQKDYLDTLDFNTENLSKKETTNSSTTLKAKKKYFN